jgi:hypothetical protein
MIEYADIARLYGRYDEAEKLDQLWGTVYHQSYDPVIHEAAEAVYEVYFKPGYTLVQQMELLIAHFQERLKSFQVMERWKSEREQK